MLLTGYQEITGILVCEDGLKIGGTKETAGIGETDNPIIRHPVSRLPYVPGSSLKGKIRSLTEWRTRPECQNTGRPCGCGDCDVCFLFGSNDIRRTKTPTRLIFRDAPIDEDSARELGEVLPGSFIEDKTEIAMDRQSGKTRGGSLRQQERVPAGTRFRFSFVMRQFDDDTPKHPQWWRLLAQAVDDLEKDYLGGNGTRGYGKVRLTTEDDKPLADYLRSLADGTKPK